MKERLMSHWKKIKQVREYHNWVLKWNWYYLHNVLASPNPHHRFQKKAWTKCPMARCWGHWEFWKQRCSGLRCLGSPSWSNSRYFVQGAINLQRKFMPVFGEKNDVKEICIISLFSHTLYAGSAEGKQKLTSGKVRGEIYWKNSCIKEKEWEDHVLEHIVVVWQSNYWRKCSTWHNTLRRVTRWGSQ